MSSDSPNTTAPLLLYGREDQLRDAVQLANAGCSLFAIEGVTGIGKSALLSEITNVVARDKPSAIAHLNAAQRPSEDLAIASIYLQLHDVARDKEAFATQLAARFKLDLPGSVRKVFAAVIADAIKLVAEKAEKTVDAIQEVIAGEGVGPAAEERMEALDGDGRRYFFSEFLIAMVEAGNEIVVAIDNFDSADDSLVSLVRFLIKEKPAGVTVVLAHNNEVGDNAAWDYVVADVRARGGSRFDLPQLNRGAIGAWFHDELGRWPTNTELDELEEASHGRAQDLRLAIDAKKKGTDAGVKRDYRGYYELSRRNLGSGARAVAELLAVLNADTLVDEDLLAVAGEQLGVEDLGSALDELHGQRLLKRRGKHLGLAHSLAQRSWNDTINGVRRAALGAAWFHAVRGMNTWQLTSPEITGLLPAIAGPLTKEKTSEEVATIGAKLIAAGQYRTGLDLLDRTWRFEPQEHGGGPEMFQHALLAARTRLNLGRYREVDEPLTHAELEVGDDSGRRTQVTLLRMRLSLRRNTYEALFALAVQLEKQAAGDAKALVEGALILNTAYRDLLDLNGLAASRDRLFELRDGSLTEQTNSINRALARTLAKLGETDAALECAQHALRSSYQLDSIRAVGNANLSLAEVLRYRGEHGDAISAYREAATIARATGNRDSQLWALLGEAASHFEDGTPEMAAASLSEVEALLAEAGYDHPLETAHCELLRALVERSPERSATALRRYESLHVEWPIEFLGAFLARGKSSGPTPL